MAENPESLNSLVNHQSQNSDNAVDTLRHQLRLHEETNDGKTALDKLVEVVWHKDDKTLDDLKTLETRVEGDLSRGNNADLAGLGKQINSAVQADQSAMQRQNSVEFYTGSFLKAVPLFAGKSKLMMAASIGFNALDAVHAKDQGGEVAADLALGGLKGFALKKTFDVLGGQQFSLGAEGSGLAKVSGLAGVGLKGVAIGGLSRFYDTALNRQNLVNDQGHVDPLKAVSMAARAAVDGKSMAIDATMFMTAHGAFTGLSRLGASAVEASPALQKLESSTFGSFVKGSKMLPGSAMGATFGFSSGAVGEIQRQHQSGEAFDINKVLKRGAFQALTDGAAGASGSAATYASHLSGIESAPGNQQPAGRGRMGGAFAGEDAESGGPGKVGSTDLGAAHTEVNGADHAGEHHLDGLEKTAADQPAPPLQGDGHQSDPAAAASDSHTIDEAFKPIFDQSVRLASAAVQPGASSEDVINFFKYTAGDGQHVRANMEDVARQAAQYGNTAMEALIKQAYATTPETASQLDTGLGLAEAANRHGATSEDDRNFLEFAYGPGKSAEIPLRIAAELSGNSTLDARLQEAYAGANGLTRNSTLSRISLNGINPDAANILQQILANPPDNAESHQLFRQNLHTWLDAMPDHHDVVKAYAQQTRSGVIAAVVDGKLNTDYLKQFPDRSLTAPHLLDMLKGMDQHRVLVHPDQPVQEQGAPAQTATGDNQSSARTNPYKPAVEHLPVGKLVNPDSLIHEFENTSGRAKQARAYLLSDFIGNMNEQQFANWLDYGLTPVQGEGVPAGTTNFSRMLMPGADVLARPEIANALKDPDHAGLDLKTVQNFLSKPNTGLTSPPPWQTEFIANRIEIAALRASMTAVPEGQESQAADPAKIVKDAVPGWFLKGIRDRGSVYDRNAGTATYPHDFDDDLAQMLENQRYLERQNPKYRESTPPANAFADRVATLQKALEVQQTTTAPELVPQILKLGTNDQPAVRGILDKLDLETNAPEWTELLKIAVPKAQNIQDVKTLLDAMYFGKKSDSTAFKARKDGKTNDFAERDRDNNLALARATAAQIVPAGQPGSERLQEIANLVITGKIRDPRPGFDGPGGKGGPGGAGGGPGGKGGREFRQRPNTPPEDRRRPEDQTKTVPPVVAPPEPVPERVDQATTLQPAAQNGAAESGLERAGGGPLLNAGAGDNSEEPVLADLNQLSFDMSHLPDGQKLDFIVPVEGKISGLPIAAKGDGSELPPTLENVDMRPLDVAGGRITPAPEVAASDHAGASTAGVNDILARTVAAAVDPEQDQSGYLGHQRGGHQDDDESGGYKDRNRQSKPKGGARDGRGRRERGGANAQRYSRDPEDYD